MLPRRPRRKARAVLLVLVPLALVATAAWVLTDRSPAAAPPTAEPAAHRLDVLRSRLPFHGLLRTPTDATRRAHEAEQRLVAACMADRGFTYTPAPAASDDSGADSAPFGFEPRDTPADGGRPAPQPSEQPRGEDFTRALYGDPDRRISAHNEVIRVTRPATGCLAEAQEHLLGEDGRVRDLTLRLVLDQGERDAVRALRKDAAQRAVTARWRACMAEAGITADDPVRLAADLPTGADATHPSARADLACKARTGYLERAYTRLAATQRHWLDTHPGPVAEWRTLHRREDTAARRVLASTAPTPS
ncbi:hypothetical protein [Streptomyces sp. enrichment culture]|uniref:hypothetical protein n=1 Tax=Streptomyces sp. enrichment culture TaxID=1795815 RepID=UPI003F55086A